MIINVDDPRAPHATVKLDGVVVYRVLSANTKTGVLFRLVDMPPSGGEVVATEYGFVERLTGRVEISFDDEKPSKKAGAWTPTDLF